MSPERNGHDRRMTIPTRASAILGSRWLGRWLRRAVVLAVLMLTALATVAPAHADTGDYAVEGGRVFTQAVDTGVPDAGFAVTDAAGIPFWTEFQRLGGVQALGYPLSRRFTWDGFIVQVFQKVVLQWRPELNAFEFVNVFDRLSLEGYDAKLEELLVPPSENFDEAGLTWDRIIASRQGLLNANPALRDAYFAVDDPLRWYGLPTSRVVTYEHVHTIRLQRAVLQQWLVDLPWASPGEVTVANGGDLARGAGIFPAEVLAPEVRPRADGTAPPSPPTPTPGPTPGATPQPTAAPPQPTAPPPQPTAPPPQQVDLLGPVTALRAALGLPSLIVSPELMQAAQGHANYYIAHLDDPNSGGLHTQVFGYAGFTGRTIGDRARAAGYPLGWVDEVFAFFTPANTVTWALETVWHRYMFIHPSAVHVGYGTATGGGTTITVFNVGLSPQHTADAPLPAVVPVNGATDVAISWAGWESPNPAPGALRPFGPAISLQFGLNDEVEWGEAGLYGPGGAAVTVARTLSQWRRALSLVPHEPLAPGTTYTVRVTGTRNGQPFTAESSFTTRQA